MAGADPGICNGGGTRYMLDHLRCAVGALNSQKILILKSAEGGGGRLSPKAPSIGSTTAMGFTLVNTKCLYFVVQQNWLKMHYFLHIRCMFNLFGFVCEDLTSQQQPGSMRRIRRQASL